MLVSNFNPLEGFRTRREIIAENGLGKFRLPKNTVVRRAYQAKLGDRLLLVDAYVAIDCVIYGVRLAIEDLEPISTSTLSTSPPP